VVCLPGTASQEAILARDTMHLCTAPSGLIALDWEIEGFQFGVCYFEVYISSSLVSSSSV
jgi:hypothetical protein